MKCNYNWAKPRLLTVLFIYMQHFWLWSYSSSEKKYFTILWLQSRVWFKAQIFSCHGCLLQPIGCGPHGSWSEVGHTQKCLMLHGEVLQLAAITSVCTCKQSYTSSEQFLTLFNQNQTVFLTMQTDSPKLQREFCCRVSLWSLFVSFFVFFDSGALPAVIQGDELKSQVDNRSK